MYFAMCPAYSKCKEHALLSLGLSIIDVRQVIQPSGLLFALPISQKECDYLYLFEDMGLC